MSWGLGEDRRYLRQCSAFGKEESDYRLAGERDGTRVAPEHVLENWGVGNDQIGVLTAKSGGLTRKYDIAS